jgi:hypothetical protein
MEISIYLNVVGTPVHSVNLEHELNIIGAYEKNYLNCSSQWKKR